LLNHAIGALFLMINLNVRLATVVIVALGTIGTTTTAFAQTFNPGVEIADELVHEFAPEADIPFHQGLCQAGITTEALEELGGCEILPPIGETD
jgi:hypothetical protein